MRKYLASAVLAIQAGVIIGLTRRQATDRAHALRPQEGVSLPRDAQGTYTAFFVLQAVQFKAGEEFYANIEPNKQLAQALEPADQARKKDTPKKDAAEAKALEELRTKAKAWDDVQPELQRLRAATAQFDTKDLDAEIESARVDAAAWRDLQGELETLQTKAALWDTLPETVRKDAVDQAEAALAADQGKKK